MDEHKAQNLLVLISIGLGCLGFLLSMCWHRHWGKAYDWAERLARSAYVSMQFIIWGGTVGFLAMYAIFGINFGGTK